MRSFLIFFIISITSLEIGRPVDWTLACGFVFENLLLLLSLGFLAVVDLLLFSLLKTLETFPIALLYD